MLESRALLSGGGVEPFAWASIAHVASSFPQQALPTKQGQAFVVEDWDNKVTDDDVGLNYFGGNSGPVNNPELPGSERQITKLAVSPDSHGSTGGSLRIDIDFTVQASQEAFGGFFTSLFGLTDTKVVLEPGQSEPADSTPFPGYYLDFDNVFGAFKPFAGQDVEQIALDVRLDEGSDPSKVFKVKVELKDELDYDLFTRVDVDSAAWTHVVLDRSDFTRSVYGEAHGTGTAGFDWNEVSKLSIVVERRHEADGVNNPDKGVFLVDNLRLLDNDGFYPDLDAVEDADGGLRPEYERAFLDYVRSTSSLFFLDFASRDPRTGGIIQDRSTYPDLMTMGGAGFQLTSYVISAERGYLSRREAADRVLDILQVLYTHPQGPEAQGTIGYQGFFYHFLGIDGLRRHNFDRDETPVDDRLNTVELSTIDTALAVAGVVTAGQYFDGDNPVEQQIRGLAEAIYGRVNWPFMLDTATSQFYLGWKPNEPRDDDSGLFGRFKLDDADGLGQYSSKDVQGVEQPATLDYYTDEGLLVALLAMGSPNPQYRLDPDVWYAMTRDDEGGAFVKTYPGSLFTYQFLSAWVQTALLGPDNHPTRPVDWFQNTREAIDATMDYVAQNPNDRESLSNPHHWGLSACEGPLDAYFAEAAPPAAIALEGSLPWKGYLEAEYGNGQTENRPRTNASNGYTARLLDGGQVLTRQLDAGVHAEYQFHVRYSNDGDPDTLQLRLDGNPVGGPFQTIDTRPPGGAPGDGWNEFAEIAVGSMIVEPGQHELTLTVNATDAHGVEIDWVALQSASVPRPLEVGTVTNYGVGASILHAPAEAIAALWHNAQHDDLNEDGVAELLHPRFGFADAFNLDVADVIPITADWYDPPLVRSSGGWANFTGFAIDHGPMLIMIDNYLEANFIPRLFMSHPGIAEALGQLFEFPPEVHPTADFLIDSANRYCVSERPVDLGQPMVPVYTDYNAWGTYGAIDGLHEVTLDANDPDAGQGTSSMKVSWTGVGPSGYFQFGLGTSHINRPRDIPEFGNAAAARFMAKGDTDGQQIRVAVFRTLGSGWQQIASQVIALTTQWQDFAISLASANVTPSDLHAIQFVIGDGLPAGGGTFWVDYVRFGTDGDPGYDPARLVQSYRALWADAEPPPPAGSVADRDLNVYPNRSFLYDNALAIKTLLASGDAAARKVALDLADTLVLLAQPDGSLYNNRAAGHVFNGDGSLRLPLDLKRTLGDNAWCGLALLDAYGATGDEKYLDAARAISDWAEANLRYDGLYGGYRGGYDELGNPLLWRSTEHNIDLFALNKYLAFVLGELADASAAATYAARATHAGDFVLAMYNPAGNHFWTGADNGDAINTASIPLDAQLWAIQAMSLYSQYAGAVDWDCVLAWSEANLWDTDGPYSGFTYSTQALIETPHRVWLEGVGQGAAAYDRLGQTAKFEQSLATLQFARTMHPNGDGLGIVAASSDELKDTPLGAVYDARLHVGATAWALLARLGREPFAPFDVAEFLGPVDYLERNDLNPSADGLWYRGEASRDGLLTLEATVEGGPESVELTLYDGDLARLTTSTPVAGKSRIDWQVAAGEQFYFHLGDAAGQIDLRVADLVRQEGATVTVYGTETDNPSTSGADRFAFDPLASPRLAVNGVGYDFGGLPLASVTFYGGGGEDTATLSGSAKKDLADMRRTITTLVSPGLLVTVIGVEQTAISGRGGADVAYLHGTSETDRFTARPGEARLLTPGSPFFYEPGVDPKVGFNLVSWWNFGDQGPAVWRQAVEALYDAGFRSVSFVPFRFVDPATGELASAPHQKVPELAHVEAGIARARQLGMSVTINPFVEKEDFSWRGTLNFSAAQADQFFSDYTDYLLEVAALAQEYGATRLLVGSELEALVQDASHNQRWETLIDAVDAAYTGQIGYAANWDHYDDANLTATIWEHPAIDFLAIDAYFQNLATPEQADQSGAYPDENFIRAVQGNWERILDELFAFAAARKGGAGMPIVFNEHGLIAHNRTTTDPSNGGLSLQPADPSEQTGGYDALLRAADQRGDSLLEIDFWHWNMPGTSGSPWATDAGTEAGAWLSDFVSGPVAQPGPLLLEVLDFPFAFGYGTPGSSDVAELYGDPAGQDVFKAWPQWAKLYGAAYQTRAYDFRYTYACATPGGDDVANLFDDPNTQDTLSATPASSSLAGPDDCFVNTALSFRRVYALSSGGDDVASLVDDPGTADMLKTYPAYTKFYGPDESFFYKVTSFAKVYAVSTGGDDVACLVGDPASQNTLEAYRAHTTLYYQQDKSRFARAESFRKVYAAATPGGEDHAWLYGEAGSQDILTARPTYAILYYEPDKSHFVRANSFRQVHGVANAAEGDRAWLYDSPADDLLRAQQSEARLTDALDAVFGLYAQSFAQVTAVGTEGDDTTDITLPLTFDLKLVGEWNP